MGQTKRKRRTKHRGNAVGVVEARGRTGRKPAPGETGAGAGKGAPRGRREIKPPSWKGALGKAAFGAVMLFLLVQLGVLGEKGSTTQALTLAAIALFGYTPVMYATDNFIYKRNRQRQLQGK